MSKWQTRPKIERIEAIQYDGNNNPFGVLEEHKWCDYRMCDICGGAKERMLMYVYTKSGTSIVNKGDWVIKKPDGYIDVMNERTFLDKYKQSKS